MAKKTKEYLKVCPACGFSFDPVDQRTGEKRKKCPMCGYEFSSPEIQPKKSNHFDKRII
jgi:hypothetical protein